MKVHRWQQGGYTPCGREIARVATNCGKGGTRGVTCKACKRAKAVPA